MEVKAGLRISAVQCRGGDCEQSYWTLNHLKYRKPMAFLSSNPAHPLRARTATPLACGRRCWVIHRVNTLTRISIHKGSPTSPRSLALATTARWQSPQHGSWANV